MKTIYIILIILAWVNVLLGNDITKSIVALITTLLVNKLYKDKRGANGGHD
ncbi:MULTISPECIES: hypothetical protein [unclassified Staphylococcus]|uniref:hypothetical protein n=1 Tax=Staphylococcus TaxID=1279 RepID=UPI001950EAD0|nr:MULTISPECIES: hypothetical protein [unclassified Staphylococcus]